MTSLNTYTIRNAKNEDISRLSVLITELGYPCTAEEVQGRFVNIDQHPDYRMLVITEGETILGMTGIMKGIWVEKNGTYVRILAFVIGQEYRGLGIGKILLKAIEDWAAEVGANSIIVNSGNRDERIGAHLFYQAQGYDIKSSGFIKIL